MSLTPCKFFAQGSCRFGNNCRFYHEPRGQAQTGMFGNRTLAPPTFQPAGGAFNQGQGALNLTAKSNQNLDIIVEGVKKDMQEWQACKIWPYSCYGPVGGKPCIPGFDDVSPEEFRLAFMQQGNNLPPEMIQRSQQIQQLRLNYQQATMDNRNTIERIATSNQQQSSPFGGQPTNATAPLQQAGLFKATTAQPTGSIFGGGAAFPTQQPVAAASSIFGGSSFGTVPTSTFGQSQPTAVSSVFQSPPTQTAGSIFGGQPTQGQPPPPFGATFQNPQQSASLFQTTQPQQQAGLFQTQAAGLGTGSFFQQPNAQPQQPGGLFQPQSNLLSNPPSQPQAGLFQQPQLQQQPPAGLFQNPLQQPIQTSTSLFSQPQQAPAYAPPAGSIFGGNVSQQQPAISSAPSIFGGSVGTTAFPGNVQQQVAAAPQAALLSSRKFIYSNESDLSAEEMESFRATEFTVDSLPTKPPPQSLCL